MLPQAPIPVDVDGDLIPDVTVAVNLVYVEGALFNPPQIGQVLAPNVEINRALPGLPVGAILGKSSPPLRINSQAADQGLAGRPRHDRPLRLRHPGRRVHPHHFTAVLGGLQQFFNPLQAVVDTKSGPRQADSPNISYEGPLDLVFGLEQGDFKVDADLKYRPWPDVVRVSYLSDDQGQHIDYAHGLGSEINLKYKKVIDGNPQLYVPGELPEIDLRTILKMVDGNDTVDVDARIDRMPRRLNVDIKPGRIDYKAKSDGRLPDVGASIRTFTGGQDPQRRRRRRRPAARAARPRSSLPGDRRVVGRSASPRSTPTPIRRSTPMPAARSAPSKPASPTSTATRRCTRRTSPPSSSTSATSSRVDRRASS